MVVSISGVPASIGASDIEIGLITGHSELGAGPAETDEVLISDAGTLKKINIIELLNPENFTAVALPAAADEVYINDDGTGKKITHDDLLFGANGTPSTQAHSDSAAVGSALDAARSDHKHAMPALASASTTVVGVAELATAAEVTTGTDTGRVITPDALAGSSAFGIASIQMVVIDFTVDVATGNGKFYFHVDSHLAGRNINSVHAEVITAGTTNTLDIQLHNATAGADILSTKLTVDSGETGSDTAATAAVIDTSEDDLTENDLIRVDIDAVHSTAAKGLILTLTTIIP